MYCGPTRSVGPVGYRGRGLKDNGPCALYETARLFNIWYFLDAPARVLLGLSLLPGLIAQRGMIYRLMKNVSSILLSPTGRPFSGEYSQLVTAVLVACHTVAPSSKPFALLPGL